MNNCVWAAGAALSLLCLAGSRAAESAPPAYPRFLPLRSLPIEKTLKAQDFGAVPGDGQCDVDAIRRALEALKGAPGTKLVFKKGVYNLLESTDDTLLGQPIFKMHGLQDVQIDFGGALFVIGRSHSGLMWITDCSRMILENLDVDYDPLPYTMGRVTAVHADQYCFDMEILEGYLMPDDRHFLDIIEDPSRAGAELSWNRTWGYFIDENHPGRLQEGERNVYLPRDIEKLGEGHYRYHTAFREAGCFSTVSKGDLFTYLTRCGTAFVLRENSHLTFRNVTLYASGGANFEGTYNDCLNFLGCNIRIREGRWKSSNADGFIFHSLLHGPWIEGCFAEGMSDDSVNIHIRPNFITEIINARTLRVCKQGGVGIPMNPKDYSVGDEIHFFDGVSGKVMYSANIADIRANESTVVFDRDLADLKPGTDRIESTSLYNPALSNGFVIRNNRFLQCGFERNYYDEDSLANVALFCYREPVNPEQYHIHENIRIEGNVFEDWRKRAISISNAKNITIVGNRIGEPRPPMTAWEGGTVALAVKNSTRVAADDNEFPRSVSNPVVGCSDVSIK